MNNKDTYWLTHDTNAKDDPKCALMIEQFGPEAYGIFWILIEILREQPDFCYPLALVPAIARKYNTTKDKVMAVITGYNLFEVRDEQFFYSRSLINRTIEWKEKRDHKKAVAIKAALASWEKRRERQAQIPEKINTQHDDILQVDANAMQTQSKRNANAVLINKINKINKEDNIDLFVNPIPELTTLTPEEFKDMWNEGRGNCPKVAVMTDKRKAKALARLKEFGRTREEQTEVINSLLEKIRESDFLQNEWKCNFDWLVENSGNWVKVSEGNYANRKNTVKVAVGGLNVNDKWK